MPVVQLSEAPLLLRVILGASGLLLAWILIAGGVAGVGLVVRARLVGRTPISATAVATSFWLGFAALILLLQLWHLIAPVASLALGLLAAVALLGFAEHAADLRKWSGGLDRRRAITAAGVIALVGLWAAHRATGVTANFDTYMYHIPTVEWYRQHGIVPGLANLHGRFGFNNANLLLAALLESGPVHVDSTRLLNGVLLLGLLIHITARVADWTKGHGSSAPPLFDLVLLAPLLAIVNNRPQFAGLTPGVPAAIALFSGCSMLFAAVYATPRAPSERAIALIAAMGLFASAAAIKLNVGATSALCWLLAAIVLWKLRRHEQVPRAAIAVAIALTVGISGVWLVRGWIQSGYPLYPETYALSAPDWRVPAEQAHAEFDWIRVFGHYSANPTAYNGSAWREFTCAPSAWRAPWFSHLLDLRNVWQVLFPLGLTVLGALLSARAAARRHTVSFAWWLTIPIAAGIVLWFDVAPRPSFGMPMFWLAAALFVAQAAGAVRPRRGLALAAAAFVALVAALPLLGDGLRAARATDESNIVAAASVWFLRPPSGQLVQPTRWDYPLTSYRTDSGLSIFVPQGHRCGRADLPCTSHPARNLQLRRAGELGSGFRVAGAWQAERWPNPWATFLTDWRNGDTCAAAGPKHAAGSS